MNTLTISISLFFMLLSLPLKSQCLDTNTLLDSIYTIKFQDLNGVYKIFHSSKVNEIHLKGVQYQPLIEHKVFANWDATLLHLGVDSNILYYSSDKHYVEDLFIQVKTDSNMMYKIVIYDSGVGCSMITLSPALQIIDFITWYGTLWGTIHNGKTGESFTSGINSSLKAGVIYQEYYVETQSKKRKGLRKTISKRKSFIINASGKFIPLN
jgi:hypothetical protein